MVVEVAEIARDDTKNGQQPLTVRRDNTKVPWSSGVVTSCVCRDCYTIDTLVSSTGACRCCLRVWLRTISQHENHSRVSALDAVGSTIDSRGS
jgi:hypothetical protein